VRLHTLLNLQGNIPNFIHISDGKMADVNILDILTPEAGAFYIIDRGYLDFARLFNIDQAKAYFVIRAKKNTLYKRQSSYQVDTENHDVKCDQGILFARDKARRDYPQLLRRIKYHDSTTGKTFNFLTNNFTIPANTVADLYRYRWQVELFFKWIKQHLKIKTDLYTILQVLSLTLFEKTPLDQLLTKMDFKSITSKTPNQLSLFDNLTGH